VIKDGKVIVNLIGAGGQPELREAYGATKADIRKALRIVAAQRDHLLRRWQEIQNEAD
jgi:hypothetical protein